MLRPCHKLPAARRKPNIVSFAAGRQCRWSTCTDQRAAPPRQALTGQYYMSKLEQLTPNAAVRGILNAAFLAAVAPRYRRWRSFLLREKFENRARLEVKAFVVVDGKVLNSRIGLYAQRRSDLMRRPLGRPSAPP